MGNTNCEISSDILFNCQQKPIRGQLNEVILLPKGDIDLSNCSFNGSNHMIIEAIQMNSQKRGYSYTGEATMISSDKGLVRDENGAKYRHRVPFIVYANLPTTKKELDALANYPYGYVAILKQNYKGASGNAKYEVFGWDTGLRLTVLDDTEGRNQYNIELATMEGFEEPHLPRNFYITSEAVTDAAVAALLIAQSP